MLPKLTSLAFNGIFPGGLNGEGWSSVGCKGVSWSVHCALILCPPQSKECASLGENSLWSFRSRVPHKNMCHVKLLLASRMSYSITRCLSSSGPKCWKKCKEDWENLLCQPNWHLCIDSFVHYIITPRNVIYFSSLFLIGFIIVHSCLLMQKFDLHFSIQLHRHLTLQEFIMG